MDRKNCPKWITSKNTSHYRSNVVRFKLKFSFSSCILNLDILVPTNATVKVLGDMFVHHGKQSCRIINAIVLKREVPQTSNLPDTCWKNNSNQRSWEHELDPWASDVTEQNQTDDSTSKSRKIKKKNSNMTNLKSFFFLHESTNLKS